MSLDIDKIPVVSVRDPRTVVGGRAYAVLKGPKTVTFTPFTTTNVSSSNITYSVKAPSPNVFINKYLHHLVPVRIRLLSNSPNANNLLRPGCDALRAFPLTQSYSNVTCSFNGASVSVEVGDFFSALIRYNTPENMRHREYSITPSTLDQSQNYYDLTGTIKNPLSFYGDAYGDQVGGRSAFPFKIVLNTPSESIIDTVLCEPIFVNPYFFGSSANLGGPAFHGIQNLDFQFNFYANSWARMWSHNVDNNVLNLGGPITGGQVVFNNFGTLNALPFSYSITQPQLLFEYLTPSEIQIIPKQLSYPYYRITRYPSDITGIAPGASFTVTTNNIQLASIPRRIFMFCRLNNQTLQSSANWCDAFAAIQKIQLNWANTSGILSSATQTDIYNIAVRNGCCMNWSSWSGEEIYKTGSFTSRISGIGSVVCLQFGTDIGLEESQAPGLIGSFNLQATINLKWPNTDNTLGAQNMTFYIVVCEEGVLDIQNLQGLFNIGVLTPQDILNSKEANISEIDYDDLVHVQGGDFLAGLKKFGQNIYDKLRMAWNKYGKKIAPYVESFVPASKPILSLADQYLGDREQQQEEEQRGEGMLLGGASIGGYRKKKGGMLLGGKMINKRSLMDRLR